MMTGIEHIGLMAKSPETLAQWYVETLDFRVIFKTEGERPIVFISGAHSGILEFIPYPDDFAVPEMKDRRLHFAIAVDDFGDAMNTLERAGVAFPDPPFDLFHGGKTVFFQDPEGNWLQIVYRPTPLEKLT